MSTPRAEVSSTIRRELEDAKQVVCRIDAVCKDAERIRAMCSALQMCVHRFNRAEKTVYNLGDQRCANRRVNDLYLDMPDLYDDVPSVSDDVPLERIEKRLVNLQYYVKLYWTAIKGFRTRVKDEVAAQKKRQRDLEDEDEEPPAPKRRRLGGKEEAEDVSNAS